MRSPVIEGRDREGRSSFRDSPRNRVLFRLAQSAVRYSLLAVLFFDEGKLDSAHVHAERAKSYAVNNPYSLGEAMLLRAAVWTRQYKFKEARSEVLRAAQIFEKLGPSRGHGDLWGAPRGHTKGTGWTSRLWLFG